MQVAVILDPLSCRGQWQKNLSDPSKDMNVPIRDLPYELMTQFLNGIRQNKNWETCIGLEFRRWKVKKKRATPRTFLEVMMKRQCKTHYLRHLAIRLCDLSFEKCFYEPDPQYMRVEDARLQASRDCSRGYLKDLAYKTLKEIAELLEDDFSWKKMGDGLGFNLYECFHFQDPLEMLQKWSMKFKDGTLMRIYFEAERLDLHEVCSYLDGIPLEKTSEILPRNPHAFYPDLRVVTIFDLEELDGRYQAIDWGAIARLVFNSSDSKKEDIWQAGTVTLSKLKEAFKIYHKNSLIGFEHFEPVSAAGVMYNQVAFLAEAIRSDSSLTEMRFQELIAPYIDFRNSQMPIPISLCLFWQVNRELDLTQFFHKTLNLLIAASPGTARILSWAFEVIEPKRFPKSPVF